MRPDGRANDALRPVTIERQYTKFAEGSVLVCFGDTKVLCTATLEAKVPSFLAGKGRGWVTAEYAMLPRSSQERSNRDNNKKGRALEISRLIGRALRSVVDLGRMGERQIIVDCDVIQADGGTRTTAITGGYVALHDALQRLVEAGSIDCLPLLGQCAAISVGLLESEPRLDLCYAEDSIADVDMNVVMRSDGSYIEIQGTGEGSVFSREDQNHMLDLAEKGIRDLFKLQQRALTGE